MYVNVSYLVITRLRLRKVELVFKFGHVGLTFGSCNNFNMFLGFFGIVLCYAALYRIFLLTIEQNQRIKKTPNN